MYRSIVAALALLVTVPSCSEDPPRRVFYEFGFQGSPEAREAFLDALDEWNACGVVTGVLRVDGKGIPVHEGDPGPGRAASTHTIDYVPTEITYRPDRTTLRYILAHELGHVYQPTFAHTAEGLMTANLGPHETFPDCAWLLQ